MHAASPHSQSYDLYLRTEGAGFVWKFTDHSITLANGHLVWTLGEQRHDVPLTNIAEVHLQTNIVGQGTIATCRITFADGFVLLVLSSSENGTYDAGQAAIYRSFVYDLHARLAALKDAAIAYTAGFSNARQKFGIVLLVVVVLFFLVLPTVLLMMTGSLSLLSSLYFGVFLAWPLYRLIQTNAPSTYDPCALPDELIDT